MDQSGVVDVDHHQFIVASVDADTSKASRRGTLAELGPGFCTVYTGIAHGPVKLHVEVLEQEPESDTEFATWEVVEEASFHVM